MTPEIKQRIEQVQRGEVPEGYKRTKAGVVPAEWEEVRIGDVLTQRKTLMCVSEDAPLLSFTIEEGVIDPANKKSNKRDFLIKDIATKKFALTEVGDIIYNPANLKFGAIHRNNLCRGVVSPIYGIFYGEQDSVFMGYLLHNQRFIDYAKVYTEGTVEKLKTLKADTFLKLKITLPLLTEQKKIAEILFAQDKLIALKEKLVEEKKQYKKALMQQLLMGRMKLPGFSKSWERIKFKKTGVLILKGQTITQKEAIPGTIPVIAGGKIPAYYCNKANRYGKTITISASGASAGFVNIYDEAIFASDCSTIGEGNDYNIVFIYNLLLNIQKDIYASQTGGAQPHIHPSDIYNLYVYYTHDIEEQNAIADVLLTCENEINLLLSELEQEKQKRKALMQLLLTGIVRA